MEISHGVTAQKNLQRPIIVFSHINQFAPTEMNSYQMPIKA